MWQVKLHRKVAKRIDRLPPDILKRFWAVAARLRVDGPDRKELPNFGRIAGAQDCYHAHIKKGQPTYVMVWIVTDRSEKILEIKYAGTHEGADYRRICQDKRPGSEG